MSSLWQTKGSNAQALEAFAKHVATGCIPQRAGPQRVKRKKPQGQKVKSTNGSRYFLKYNLNLETNWKYLKSLEIQLFKLTPMKPSYLLYMCDGLHVQSQSLHVR